MNPDAYKNALLLTARVTAGLAIGCGGTVSPTVDTPAPTPDPVTTAPPTTKTPEPEPTQKSVGLACSPPEKECCTAIFDAIEKDWSQYSKTDYRVLSACCKQEDPMYTRAACTPWGPPMPPDMMEIA
jgi:hypothetical protein